MYRQDTKIDSTTLFLVYLYYGKTDIVTAEWLDNMVFDTTVDGHHVIIDSIRRLADKTRSQTQAFYVGGSCGCKPWM